MTGGLEWCGKEKEWAVTGGLGWCGKEKERAVTGGLGPSGLTDWQLSASSDMSLQCKVASREDQTMQ